MNKHRFNKLIISLLLLLGMAWMSPVEATHIIGAEIRYQCLGNNEYKIILDVYRDCDSSSAAFDTPAYVSAFDEDGNFLNLPNISFFPLFTDTLSNNISNDPCLLPPDNVCVEHARYEGTYTIDHPGGIYLVYQRCCRNGTISNIEMPVETGSTYFTYITPESRALCNSSPEFNFYPPIFVCVGKEIEHQHAATDTLNQENDSLVYRFYTPFEGASSDSPNPSIDDVSPPPYDTVVWINPPYSLEAVLGPSSIAELSIDSHTGLITGFPEIQGQFVVGVLVEEYRNGVLLSVTRRDFQYNVGECVQVTAEVVADTAQCDNLTVNFGNNTEGPENFAWYYITGMDTTFFSDETEPTFTFPDTGKYQVMLVAEPGFDCVDTTFHPLLLQNNSLTADFSWQTFDCTNESVLVLEDLSEDFVSPPADWFWEIITATDTLTSTAQDTVFTLPNPTSGTISLTVQSVYGCIQTKTVTFETGLNNPSDLLPDLIEACIGNTVALNPNGPTNGFTYQWAPPVPPASQNLVNPSVNLMAPATYNFAVTITGYNDLCVSVDTVMVRIDPAVVLDFEADTDCDARMVTFINTSQNAPAGYVWDFGDLSTNSDVSTANEPSYIYPDFGTYNVTLSTPPGAVCSDTITREILIEEKILEADFDFDFVQCEDGEVAVSFTDVSINNQLNTVAWLWEFSGAYNGSSQLANPTITINQEGALIVTLTVTTAEGCTALTVPQSLDIALTELPCLIDGEVQGCLEEGVILNDCGDPNYTYQWTPSTGLSCDDCPSPFANPTQTTTYTAFVENISADTCFITRVVTVVVPDDVNLTVSDDVMSCDSSAILTASTSLLPVTYNWFDMNGALIADNLNTITVDITGYQNYIVQATDELGCHYTDTILVAGGPVNIATSGDQTICSNDPLDVFATNLDNNDTLSWSWTPANAFSGATDTNNPDYVLSTGNQILEVTATNQFGCEETAAIELDILDANNNLDFDFEIACNGTQVSFTNQSTNAYNYLWNFGDPSTSSDTSHAENPSYTYPGEGSFTVELSLDFDLDCFTPIAKEVIIDSTQFAVDFDFEYVDCAEDSVAIQFFNTTTFFVNNVSIDSFQWILSNGLNSNEENPVFTIETGDDLGVELTIWTSNGCTGMDDEFIKFEFPNSPLPDSIILCPGDSIFLNPAGNISFEYNWSPNTSIDSTNVVNPQVWPTQTTTYTVQITSFVPDTCSIVKEITVFVPNTIDLSITGEELTCGLPITLTAAANVAPLEYTWTAIPPDMVIGMGSTISHYPTEDTRYHLSAEDQYGCTDTTSYFVINEAIDVDLTGTGDNVCPESPTILQVVDNADDHNNTYEWSATAPGMIESGGNTASPTVITPTAGDFAVYSVIVNNQFGCDDTLSIELEGYAFVPTVVEIDTFCAGIAQSLNPGADTNLNYEWSPAIGFNPTDPNPLVTLDQTTVFTVIVSAGFGFDNCADTLEVTAFVPPSIEIMGTLDTFTCGSEIELVATTNVNTSINWLDAQGSLIQTGNPLISNPSDSETYIAVAFDDFNCEAADTLTVVNNELLIQLDGAGVIDTCPLPFYNLCVNNFDPNDILTYDWSAIANGTIESGENLACADVTTVEGTTAQFTVLVSNQFGCTSEETAEISTFSFDPQIRDIIAICPNIPTPINPEAAGSDLSYIWSPQIGLDCYDCPNPTATLSQDQQYDVIILGANGVDTCSFGGTVNVLVNPMIGLTTNPLGDTSLCEMTNVTLAASTSSLIVDEICWYENTFSNEVECADETMVMPTGTVTYFAIATDTLGCKDTLEVTVNAFPINVSLEEEIIFCEEEESQLIEVINNAPDQVLTFTNWQDAAYIVDAAGDSSSIVVDNVPAEQVFTVDIENQYGCTLTDSTTVLYFDVDPTIGDITSTMDTIYFGTGEFSQMGITDFNPDYDYEWIPQDGLSDPFIHDPEAEPAETTEYLLVITNEFGCFTERIDTIVVLNPDCGEPDIFLPNAFTPNGDGSNDVLFLRSNIVESMELSIYNRWGELMFRTNDQSIGWDGSYQNKRMPQDVYGFYLRANCFNGQEFTKKGNVMILR